MKKDEIQPSWAQIFVCFAVSILAFWFVYSIGDKLFFDNIPALIKYDWLDYFVVALYAIVIGLEIIGCLKLYQLLIKKAIETETKYREEQQSEH